MTDQGILVDSWVKTAAVNSAASSFAAALVGGAGRSSACPLNRCADGATGLLLGIQFCISKHLKPGVRVTSPDSAVCAMCREVLKAAIAFHRRRRTSRSGLAAIPECDSEPPPPPQPPAMQP
jgi:hypothetical protein